MHYSPLAKRKEHIEKLLEKINLDGEFITEYDREFLKEKDKRFIQEKNKWDIQLSIIKKVLIDNMTFNNKNISLKQKIYWNFIKKTNGIFTPHAFKFRKLSLPEISLTMKHFTALSEISKSSKPSLIIEDDVILKPQSKSLIKKSYELCKNKFDFIDLGGGCDLPLYDFDNRYKEDKRFVSLRIPRSRTTAAYMINPKTASKIINGLLPVTMPLDWQYQYLMITNKIKVLWTQPPAFLHGSIDSSEIFKSSIR